MILVDRVAVGVSVLVIFLFFIIMILFGTIGRDGFTEDGILLALGILLLIFFAGVLPLWLTLRVIDYIVYGCIRTRA